MRRLLPVLLASFSLFPGIAYAADADSAAAAEATAEAESGSDIVVFGKGETRQVQEVRSSDIAILTPGISPIRAIEKLPSVNIQSADPFGNYEWSTRVTIRSFSQNQLGFTFDGIPLGDMSYGNHNGLHISRATSSENIGSIRVSQGAGSIGSNATNNLGGTVETYSMDPKDHFALDANATYGSNDTMRGFARVNLGSAGGARGFVSYAYGSTDKYKGEGVQDQHMINAKLVVPIGSVTLDGWFSYSDRREQDYQDMSLDMLSRLGYSFDNTFPDYARAILYADIGNNRGETNAPVSNAAAGTVYPGGVATVDDAYYDASGLRKDTLAAIGLKAPLGASANLAIRGYYHHNTGMGLWGTPYAASPNGVPISIRTTEYDIDRVGLFGSFDVKIGPNAIVIGAWYENNKFNQARRFYGLASRTAPERSFREYPKNPFFTQWEFDFTTETLQYHVQDQIDLGTLKINLGWKGFKVTNQAVAIKAGGFPAGNFKTEDWFQPHAGFAVELGDKAEVFGGFTQSTRAFPSVNGSIWGTTQEGFDAIRNTIKPETSDTYELGARYNDSLINAVIGVYLVNFNDRLLSVASGPAILGSPSILQNVGSVRSAGFEAAVDFKLGGGFGLFTSYSYTDATYRNDVLSGTGALVAAIKGKTVIDTPKHLLRGELSYDKGQFFGRIGANYMSKRYFTFTNDLNPGDGLGSLPGRAIVDATLGYRISESVELQLNASNLFDKQHIATINSGGTGNSGDRQTLLVGAPQQFFVTLKAGF
jgi:iron complex outermembrane receptor protein